MHSSLTDQDQHVSGAALSLVKNSQGHIKEQNLEHKHHICVLSSIQSSQLCKIICAAQTQLYCWGMSRSNRSKAENK